MSAVSLEAMGDRAAETRLWATAFGAVVALHAVPLVILACWLGPMNPLTATEPAAAVMIDMAPAPSAAPDAPTRNSIEPRRQPVLAAPLPSPLHLPKSPLVSKTDVALPAVDTRPADANVSAPQTTAPPAAVAPPAPVAAPSRSVSEANSNAAPTWQALVLGRLEQLKRYPALAQMQGQHGVVYLRFTMNRNGDVLSAKIEKSSGSDLLDEETLALIHRAQPLPRPPPQVVGDPLELVVPVQFFLSSRR